MMRLRIPGRDSVGRAASDESHARELHDLSADGLQLELDSLVDAGSVRAEHRQGEIDADPERRRPAAQRMHDERSATSVVPVACQPEAQAMQPTARPSR